RPAAARPWRRLVYLSSARILQRIKIEHDVVGRGNAPFVDVELEERAGGRAAIGSHGEPFVQADRQRGGRLHRHGGGGGAPPRPRRRAGRPAGRNPAGDTTCRPRRARTTNKRSPIDAIRLPLLKRAGSSHSVPTRSRRKVSRRVSVAARSTRPCAMTTP